MEHVRDIWKGMVKARFTVMVIDRICVCVSLEFALHVESIIASMGLP